MFSFLLVFALAIVVLFAGLAGQRNNLFYILVLGLSAALGLSVWEWIGYDPAVEGPSVLAGMLSFDYFALSFGAVALLAMWLIALMSGYSFRQLNNSLGDHYGLMLFSLCGAFCLFSYESLLMLFLGVEILSIPLYVLAGSQRQSLASNEAALKYYLMGSFASGILLFGIALLFGSTNSLDLHGMQTYLSGSLDRPGLFYTGLLLVFIGMSFKVAAVPFHFWSPDVYEGSPTLVTTFMATVVKMASFAAFFRLATVFGPAASHWGLIVAILAALTIVVGNVTAVYQDRFKRLLAYSSVSHTGYLFLGLLAGTPDAGGAVFLYLLAYVVATIGAFAVFQLVSEQTGKQEVAVFNGLAKRHPWLAFAMAVSVLSMAGIPPMAGFFGKYFLFAGALADWTWLVVIALLGSAVSIYYYFRVIVAMYFTPAAEDTPEISVPWAYALVATVCVALALLLSVAPGYVMGLV
jgi:NADH-quinone oxidoreductase subunit N